MRGGKHRSLVLNLLPSPLPGQGSGRAGGRRAQRSPARVKAPPCDFSRSLGLAMRGEPGAAGAGEAFLQPSPARGCEPGLAADNGGFSALTPWQGRRSFTPRGGVLEGQGKTRLRRPSPRQPPPKPCGTAGLLGGELICSGSSAARPGPGANRSPTACSGQPRGRAARPLPGPGRKGGGRTTGSGPAAPGWARGSRRGRGAGGPWPGVPLRAGGWSRLDLT